MADDGHFPLTPQTPNNGGEFLLSLLQRPTNRQSQSQSQSQSNLSVSQIPSLDPSLPPPPWPSNTSDLYPVPFPLPPWLHQHQHQSLSTTPLPPNFVGFQNPQNPFPLPLPHGNQFSGNQFPSSASGNQIPGVFEGFNNLGFPGNHDRRPNESFSPLENKLQFGSFSPSLIPQVSMNGNNFKHEVAFGDLISNGLKRNQPSDSFNSYGSSNSNLNPNSNVNVNVHSFHHGQYNAPQNHPPTKGGEGHWDSGNNRRRDLEHGVNKDKVSLGEYGFNDDRGNRLSVRDGKVYVERSHGLELSAQHDHPGRHSSRSSLQSVSTLDTEASVLNLRPEIVEGRVRDRHQGQGWMKKDAESSNGNGNDSQELDNIGEQLVDSLLLEDEPDEKSDTKHVRREKDCRGNQLLTQRMRVYKRQMRCRGDINKLTSPLLAIYESLIPPKEEKEKQKQLLTSLEKLVVKEWPSARLCLFGSCANTFGVSNSDIDICLVLRDADIDKAEILLKLADILQSANLQDVQALARARVPIIKLKDSATGISCDICINNVLAVVNSKLLRDYAQIDVRLHQLAFIVKHWAKSRGVNETYQGTLSSYAYVLMCIHFLQHRRPPILPCLQEMKITYHEFVDDIECAYFDQVEHLQTFGSQNKESIAQLVWGFFNYWAYGHDYANSVISVRTGSIISKRAKDWTRRIGNDRHLICIEDPFETSHDLGRVVDKYSIKVLREEFERAAEILQCDPNPCERLFEPYIPS